MQYASIIKEIGRGAKGAKPMTREQAQTLFGQILDGAVPDMELGAILLCLRLKGEDFEEMAGFRAALGARTNQIITPSGPRCVVLSTYNGARKQANLMPLVATLLVRQNIPVLIQGRHDFESRVSPFELLAALNIHAVPTLNEAADQLARRRLACVPLDLLSPGLDRLLSLRPRLGVRNSGHSLAKLLDPCAGRSVRVVAVTHPPYLDMMQALLSAERATALLMRGTEGEAYASPRRRPRLLGFIDGKPQIMFEQMHDESGVDAAGSCSVADNAICIQEMLDGKTAVPQPILDQVAALVTLACD
ncbi:MAG TPA: DNA-binding protein YbiB [Rhodocyclaceae bacterium]|nr:DNA-binding protein YbiB [Rhodocyclaceae bacterium]